MKKIITSVSIVLMVVILSVALVACVHDVESTKLSTGTYKFYSMSGSVQGIEFNVKVGDSIMDMASLTEDYVILEIKEGGEAVLTMGSEKNECTWEEKEGKYYLTVDGESQEIIVNGNMVTIQEEDLKLELKKA